LQIRIALITVMFSYTVYRSKIDVILSSILAFNKGINTFLTIFLILNRNFSSLGEGSYADQHCCNLRHGSKLILQIQLKDAGDYLKFLFHCFHLIKWNTFITIDMLVLLSNSFFRLGENSSAEQLCCSLFVFS